MTHTGLSQSGQFRKKLSVSQVVSKLRNIISSQKTTPYPTPLPIVDYSKEYYILEPTMGTPPIYHPKSGLLLLKTHLDTILDTCILSQIGLDVSSQPANNYRRT